MTLAPDRIEGMSFVCAAVVFEAFGQIALKRAADLANAKAQSEPVIADYLHQSHWFAAGICSFIIEGLLWTIALKFLPVSVAQPAGSLVLVVVALLSRVILRERLASQRWFGIALILGGVAMVGAF